MKRKYTLSLLLLLFIFSNNVKSQTHTPRPHTVSLSCTCGKDMEGAIKSLSDSSLTLIHSNFSTVEVLFKDIKKIAVYPPKHKPVPGFLYLGGFAVMGGSLFRDDVRTSIYTGLSGVGMIFLGLATEKILYKPIFKKKINVDSDRQNLKQELEHFKLP